MIALAAYYAQESWEQDREQDSSDKAKEYLREAGWTEEDIEQFILQYEL